jgi:hypothetical protein
MLPCLITAVIFLQTTCGAASDAETDADRATAVRKTYIIILQNETRLPAFYEDRQEMGNGYRVELDTPWQPDTKFVRSAEVEKIEPERPRDREIRIKKGWEERHFTEVNGRYYPTNEVELAKRAQKMATTDDAGASEPRSPSLAAPVVPANAPDMTTTPPAPPQARSMVAQFWPHAALILIAAAIAGIVLPTFIFHKS